MKTGENAGWMEQTSHFVVFILIATVNHLLDAIIISGLYQPKNRTEVHVLSGNGLSARSELQFVIPPKSEILSWEGSVRRSSRNHRTVCEAKQSKA